MNDINEQIVRINVDNIRRMSELPEEVTVICVVPLEDRHHFAMFSSIPPPDKTLLLRVRSKFSIRHPPRSLLFIEEFDDFITRYHSLEEKQR